MDVHTTSPLSPEDPPEIGGFELLARIGQGGMGQVYLGESPGGEQAAVKVIKPALVDSESRLRFAQEIEVLKTVWGNRVAAFLDADPEAEPPWLATEYVEGADLRRHVDAYGPIPAVLVASLGATLAEALALVHKQGLLHRDLKPANVLLGPNGPKIIDFGLAVFAESGSSLTAPNTVVGTPMCMAPEQAGGVKPLTEAVDAYALGAVLLFALTGRYPYQAANVNVLFHMVTDPDTPPNLTGVPTELSPILASMLAHEAKDRPSLPSVVKEFRTVIEAHGLKVTQARRQLTALTTAKPAPGYEATAPTVQLLPPVPTDTPPTQAPPAPLFVPPPSPAPDESPAYTPTVKDVPAATPTPACAPGPASAPPSASPPRAPRRSLQARRTAQQLRETYAAKAPF
ncbi:serine/threonine-protein kinase [Kitasatospora purpeofusca]|nr:serine/threonine-protein kinase [Kitasatospora purpeofusca]MCX4758287.1 serine/threonine protein kinase [Kitasatospora purpeofusca]